MDHVRLTGRTRVRLHRPLFGSPLLVFQVQERGMLTTNIGGQIDTDEVTRWRDATVEDLAPAALDIRSLIS